MPATENSHCNEVPENMLAAETPPEALPAPPEGDPLAPVLVLVCPAASHQSRLPLACGSLEVSSVQRVAQNHWVLAKFLERLIQ